MGIMIITTSSIIIINMSSFIIVVAFVHVEEVNYLFNLVSLLFVQLFQAMRLPLTIPYLEYSALYIYIFIFEIYLNETMISGNRTSIHRISRFVRRNSSNIGWNGENELTHLRTKIDKTILPTMVDVSSKSETLRIAHARVCQL